MYNGKTVSDNTEFRGVVPTVAIASHTSGLAGLVEQALLSLPLCGSVNEDSILLNGRLRTKPDAIAVTRGPGMMANLAVGLNTAKGLSLAMQRPMIGVNHMQAHALTPRLVSAMENFAQGSSASEYAALEAGKKTGVLFSQFVMTEGKEMDNRPSMEPEYPFLTLLVSGGHTQLSLSLSPTSHPILASVSHLALGRMLDHSARLILPPELLAQHQDVMYGRLMEEYAFPRSNTDEENYGWYVPPAKRRDEITPSRAGDSWRWTLPVPLADTRRMEYDFTGLRGSITKIVHHEEFMGLPFSEAERRTMAREVMRLCFEHLASRILFVLAGDVDHELIAADAATDNPQKHRGACGSSTVVRGRNVRDVVVAGGVASNRFLRHVLRKVLDARGYAHVRLGAPPTWLCTDNAAMIAWTGAKMWDAGYRTSLDVLPRKKWSVDHRAEDGGVLGVDGWVMHKAVGGS